MYAHVLHFLEKFQENSLLENVNLHVAFFDYHNYYGSNDEAVLRLVLIHILPVISSVHSIQIDSPHIDLFNLVYHTYNYDNPDSDSRQECELQLLKKMMAQTRILQIDSLNSRSLLGL
jgi:hypothetical protein